MFTRYVVKELIDTEQQYVRELKQVQEKFVDVVAAGGDLVTKEVKDAMDAVFAKLKFKKMFDFHG